MKLLITGGSGLLGKALIEGAGAAHEIAATFLGDYEMADTGQTRYYKLDIDDQAGHERLFADFRPEVVVHTAGIGNPDFAEKNQALTWRINVDGTSRLLALCAAHGSKFIYISSNGIYDGAHAPYGENDPAEPLNYYGRTKLAGEAATRGAAVTAAIVRPILMYGWHYPFERKNIVTMALAALRRGAAVNAYDDVFSNPLYAGACAEAIYAIIEGGKYGDFNIAGRDRVSIFQLLRQAAASFGLDPELIKPVQQGFFNELVARPKDTSYRTDKMERELGLRPLSLAEGFELMRRSER